MQVAQAAQAPLDALGLEGVPNTVRRERLLLTLAGLFVFANRVGLLLVGGQPISDLWPLGVWLVCAAGGHLALNRLVPDRDPLIFPTVMLLAGWGLTLVARLAPPFATRQVIWLMLGTGALAAAVAEWPLFQRRWIC